MNDTWVRVGLTQEQVAAGKQQEIMMKFADRHMVGGAPQEAALFARDGFLDPGAGSEDHFEVLYFSPAAVQFVRDIIQEYQGAECGVPPKKGTSLLAGHQGAFALLGA